jgi:hypothetical protein
MGRSVLKGLVKRQLTAVAIRILDGQLTPASLSNELFEACRRAGSEASHLLGREAFTQLIDELCPPRAATELETLARDISYLLYNRWDHLEFPPWPGGDLASELIRLFEVRPELRARSAAFIDASPALNDDVLAEPLCVDLEQALQTYHVPTAH